MLACLRGGLVILLCLSAGSAPGDELHQPEAIAKPLPTQAPRSSEQAFLFPSLDTIKLSANTPPAGELPPDRAARLIDNAIPVDSHASRGWNASLYQWRAPLSHHQPLYFEQAALERYGQTYSSQFQPLISTAHFFGCALALPVNACVAWPGSTSYTLGRYRPGGVTPSRLPSAE